MSAESRIVPLRCKVQNYSWGMLGSDGLVGALARIHQHEDVEMKPCAEFWIGAHKNGLSTLTNGMTLEACIRSNPSKWLGEHVSEKFHSLPFLLKVLSIQKALSIQIHPDSQTAAELHQANPELYPDASHKPELAVALGPFEALCGFRTLEEINHFLNCYNELQSLLGIFQIENKADLQKCCVNLFRSEPASIEVAINTLCARMESRRNERRTKEEKFFLKLVSEFGNDVGCLCVFFLNHVCLKEGEAIFIGPNVPHAYLGGEIVECMAASDNVIRAGLTSKPKDIETLLRVLECEPSGLSPHYLSPHQCSPFAVVYEAPVNEFRLVKFHFGQPEQADDFSSVNSPAVVLVIQGTIQISSFKETVIADTGSVNFISPETWLHFKSLQPDTILFCAYCNI